MGIFDCALLTTRGDELSDKKGATGTRKFMSDHLLHKFEKDDSVFSESPNLSVSSKLDDVFNKSPTDELYRKLLETSTRFVADTDRFNVIANNVSDGTSVRQSPATDVESLFWVVVLYVVRAKILGVPITGALIHHSSILLQELQGRTMPMFYSLRTWVGGAKRSAAKEYAAVMKPVLALLDNLAIYFSVPWFADPEAKSDPYHAHDFFQAQLLPVIVAFRKKDVEVDGAAPLELEGLARAKLSPNSPFVPTTTRKIEALENWYIPTAKRQKTSPELEGGKTTLILRSEKGERPQKRPRQPGEVTVEPCHCTIDYSPLNEHYTSLKYLY